MHQHEVAQETGMQVDYEQADASQSEHMMYGQHLDGVEEEPQEPNSAESGAASEQAQPNDKENKA